MLLPSTTVQLLRQRCVASAAVNPTTCLPVHLLPGSLRVFVCPTQHVLPGPAMRSCGYPAQRLLPPGRIFACARSSWVASAVSPPCVRLSALRSTCCRARPARSPALPPGRRQGLALRMLPPAGRLVLPGVGMRARVPCGGRSLPGALPLRQPAPMSCVAPSCGHELPVGPTCVRGCLRGRGSPPFPFAAPCNCRAHLVPRAGGVSVALPLITLVGTQAAPAAGPGCP